MTSGQGKVSTFETGKKPLVIGHRGASAAYRENTIDAFVGAAVLGADWVELDVRALADGELAVHHDPGLVDGRLVCDLTVANKPREVALLADALVACGAMGVNVEIKQLPREPDFDPAHRQVPAVVDTVRAWGGTVLISSFDPAALVAVQASWPDAPTALLVAPVADPMAAVDAAVAGGHQALHPFVARTDAALVRRCHEAGLAVNVWTVDDPERIAELAAMGVDGIVTNVPDVARAVLDG